MQQSSDSNFSVTLKPLTLNLKTLILDFKNIYMYVILTLLESCFIIFFFKGVQFCVLMMNIAPFKNVMNRQWYIITCIFIYFINYNNF